MEFDLSAINPFILFISGVLLLYYSSETIINNSILISEKYNISKLLIGIFILAVGTSLPELFVSIIAILKESPSIVLGNIIGFSNSVSACADNKLIKKINNAYKIIFFILIASVIKFFQRVFLIQLFAD